MTTHPSDTAQAIVLRRQALLEATEQRARRAVLNRTTWTPCEGTGRPMVEPWMQTDSRGHRVAYGWCGTCGDLAGGRWTNGARSGPLPDGVVLARRHKDKRVNPDA